MDKDFQDILNEMAVKLTHRNDDRLKTIVSQLESARAEKKRLSDLWLTKTDPTPPEVINHSHALHLINLKIAGLRKARKERGEQISKIIRSDPNRKKIAGVGVGTVTHTAKTGAIKVAGAAGLNKIPVAKMALDAIQSGMNKSYERKKSAAIHHEEFDPTQKHPGRGTKECDLFLGRLQPIHLGHLKIIESMKNPVVAIVKGSKSSDDRTKNPFSAEYQIELLKKAAPHAKIITVTSGFLPAIINQLRRESLEPTAIYAGEDRIAGYQSQIDGANKRLPDDAKIHVVFKQAERVTSATTVRNAIKNDDQKTFESNMPKALWGEFGKMKEIMAEEISIPSTLLPFNEFIVEEGEPTTTTGNVVDKDRPLFKKPVKRKKSLFTITDMKEKYAMKSFKEFINEDTLDEATYTSNHTGSIESVAKLHTNAQALGGHKVIHSEVKPDGSHMMITKKGSQVRVHHITAGKSGTSKVTTITNRPATPEESKKHFAPL